MAVKIADNTGNLGPVWGGSGQRKLWKIGTYWFAFWFNKTTGQLVYSTSSDGLTWAAPTNIRAATSATAAACFATWYDGTYIHYAYVVDSANNALLYRRGTIDGTTITWAAERTCVAAVADVTYQYPTIICDSDGYPYVGYCLKDASGVPTTYTPYIHTSSTKDGTWTDRASFPYDLYVTGGTANVLMAADASGRVAAIYAVTQNIMRAQVYTVAGGWSSEVTLAASKCEDTYYASCVAIGSVAHVVTPYDTTKAYHYMLDMATPAWSAVKTELGAIGPGTDSVGIDGHCCAVGTSLYAIYNNENVYYSRLRAPDGVWGPARFMFITNGLVQFPCTVAAVGTSTVAATYMRTDSSDASVDLYWLGMSIPSMEYLCVVDWDCDGQFVSPYEDITSSVKHVQIEYGRDSDLNEAAAGTAMLTLVDPAGTYCPQNVSSPIVIAYGGIYPGRRIDIMGMMSGHVYQMWGGYVEDVIPEPDKSQQQAVLRCVDGFPQLERAHINTTIQTDQYSGGNSGLVHLALNTAGWPAGLRQVATAQLDQYPLVAADDQPCLDFMHQLERSEHGYLYCGHDGAVHYENRLHRQSSDYGLSTQWTVDQNTFVSCKPVTGLPDVRNIVVLRATPRVKAAAEADIWTLQENSGNALSPVVASAQTLTYTAIFANSNGDVSIAGDVQAVASGDYYAATSAAGGTDMTSHVATSTAIYAAMANVQVKNDGTSGPLYLTSLRVRGKLYNTQAQMSVVEECSSSETFYGKQTLSTPLPYYLAAATMRTIAQSILSARLDPRQEYEVELINSDADVWAQQMGRHISDRIALRDSRVNLSGDYYIERIRHDITEAGKWHRTTWVLSKV